MLKKYEKAKMVAAQKTDTGINLVIKRWGRGDDESFSWQLKFFFPQKRSRREGTCETKELGFSLFATIAQLLREKHSSGLVRWVWNATRPKTFFNFFRFSSPQNRNSRPQMQPNIDGSRQLQAALLWTGLRDKVVPQHVAVQLQIRVGADEREMRDLQRANWRIFL